jgi:hypothetical protein
MHTFHDVAAGMPTSLCSTDGRVTAVKPDERRLVKNFLLSASCLQVCL